MAPTSPQAKARVSRNALKHGLRAQQRFVLDHEDPQAFQTLKAQVHAQIQPIGILEAFYADQIAQFLWCLDRAGLIEAAAMNHAHQEALASAPDDGTPVQRFQRALIASIDTTLLDPIHRYASTADRRLKSALQNLTALQLSRLTGFPIPPNSVRITFPAPPFPAPPVA